MTVLNDASRARMRDFVRPPEMIARIREMAAAGASTRGIGTAIGLPWNSVKRIMKRQGIETKFTFATLKKDRGAHFAEKVLELRLKGMSIRSMRLHLKVGEVAITEARKDLTAAGKWPAMLPGPSPMDGRPKRRAHQSNRGATHCRQASPPVKVAEPIQADWSTIMCYARTHDIPVLRIDRSEAVRAVNDHRSGFGRLPYTLHFDTPVRVVRGQGLGWGP